MATKQADRKTLIRAGAATLITGMILAVTGIATSPASAYVPDPTNHKIEICHKTASGDNPYTSTSPAKWQITSPNGHGFDVGDIIPPFPAGRHGNQSWDAYGGLNWTVGNEAIYDADCGGAPNEVVETADVTLAKVLAGNAVPEPQPLSFDFTILCDTGVVADPTPTIVPGAPAVAVATGVDVGDTCTITENPVPTGAVVSYDTGASGTDSTTVTVVAGGVAVVATNTYTRQGGGTDTGSLNVTKDVDGNNAAAHANEAFPFTATCTGFDLTPNDDTGTAATFNLGDGDSQPFTGIPTTSTCTVTETLTKGASPTTIKVGAGNADVRTSVTNVAIIKDAVTEVLVTNTYTTSTGPAPTAKLSAKQACAATGMLVTITNTGDAAGVVDVTNEGKVVGNGVSIPAGGSSEVLVPVVEDTDYLIDVTQVGASKLATFRGPKDCQDVGGIVVTPKPTPAPVVTPTPAPAATPIVAPAAGPAVAGKVLARQLPRTGADTLPLAELGFGLVLLGGAAILLSRRLVPVS